MEECDPATSMMIKFIFSCLIFTILWANQSADDKLIIFTEKKRILSSFFWEK